MLAAKRRLPLAFLLSALLPFAGLPMLPYTAAILALTLWFGIIGRWTAVAVSLGLALGIGGLLLFYQHFASIPAFIHTVRGFTSVQHIPLSTVLRTRILGDSTPGADNLFTSFFGHPVEFSSQKTMFDYSAALLFALILFAAIRNRQHLEGSTQRHVFLAVAIVLTVPPLMHLAGHYRSMYRWMTYIPLCILAPKIAGELAAHSNDPALRRIAWLGFIAAIFIGIPMRTLFVIPSWSQRSPAPVTEAARAQVLPSDLVVCNFKVYFAARPFAKVVHVTGLAALGQFELIKNLPKEEISLLCLPPQDFPEVSRQVGGTWSKIPLDEAPYAPALKRSRYAVDFYRRAALD
jgi:hypothetical protein